MRGGKGEEEEKEVCLNCRVTIMCSPIMSNIYFSQSEHKTKECFQELNNISFSAILTLPDRTFSNILKCGSCANMKI